MDATSLLASKANKATADISKLPGYADLLKAPKFYLQWRDQVLQMCASYKILHYMQIGLPLYNYYMNQLADAPLPIQYVRPDISHYGDADIEFTVDQLNLITKIWDLMDAINLNLVHNHLDKSVCNHIRHHVNVHVATLSELMAALDAEFLAPGLRDLPELYNDLRSAKGITSISELLQYIKYLEAVQLLAAREEDAHFIVDAISACVNILGFNAWIVRYHELRGNDAEDPTQLGDFLTQQLKIQSYKKSPSTPTPSGILNPIMASNEIQVAALAEEVRALNILMKDVMAKHGPKSALPGTLFCSTHGMCAHTSEKCNRRSPRHCLTDTHQAWSNKAQYLAFQEQRAKSAAPHG